MEELNLHLRRALLAALSLHHPAQGGCSLVLASFLAQEARREVLREEEASMIAAVSSEAILVDDDH